MRVADYGPSRRADVADLTARVWGTRPTEAELEWFFERNPVRPASVLIHDPKAQWTRRCPVDARPAGDGAAGTISPAVEREIGPGAATAAEQRDAAGAEMKRLVTGGGRGLPLIQATAGHSQDLERDGCQGLSRSFDLHGVGVCVRQLPDKVERWGYANPTAHSESAASQQLSRRLRKGLTGNEAESSEYSFQPLDRLRLAVQAQERAHRECFKFGIRPELRRSPGHAQRRIMIAAVKGKEARVNRRHGGRFLG